MRVRVAVAVMEHRAQLQWEDRFVCGSEGTIVVAHQCRLFKLDPSGAKCPGSGTEIIPGKHSDTRIKPLSLTNGHGRYITVTPERMLVSVGEWPLNLTAKKL